MPLCFGYHPYLRLPGVPRAEWVLETPTMRHLLVDDWGLPTGCARGVDRLGGAAGATPQYDDGFDQVPDGAVFAISGGGRRVEVTFVKGYPAAQLFAPGKRRRRRHRADDRADRRAAPGHYRFAAAGKPETAAFSIRVDVSADRR